MRSFRAKPERWELVSAEEARSPRKLLPLDLLRARTRKGRIEPVYADINSENLK
ncbi:MAG: hypothetical protein GTO14_08395, partial [Anaerolineales bacterium]|nr:hypothetical protein [Candidatus Latescibacterota bacterium]NIO77877.1 hypothetical protein [Candidatus Latescibacterota bacterium]NIS80215.1 hypothetical protein [Anaerolineales bacterium]